jgi:hypothetical protein
MFARIKSACVAASCILVAGMSSACLAGDSKEETKPSVEKAAEKDKAADKSTEESKAIEEKAKRAVHEFIVQEAAKFAPGWQVEIHEHNVDGLWDALNIKIFRVLFFSKDGKDQFNDDLLLYCSDGKVLSLKKENQVGMGFSGILSSVLSDKCLYYTYGFGSGIYRSHVARIALENGKVNIMTSGGFEEKKLYVKEVKGQVQVESKNFLDPDSKSPAVELGHIKIMDSRLAIVNEKDEEVSSPLPGHPKK